MKYAVNIADMTKNEMLSTWLIKPVCPNLLIVNINKDRLDESAVILECDEIRALAILEVIRKRYSKNEFRFYENKTGKTYKRI